MEQTEEPAATKSNVDPCQMANPRSSQMTSDDMAELLTIIYISLTSATLLETWRVGDVVANFKILVGVILRTTDK